MAEQVFFFCRGMNRVTGTFVIDYDFCREPCEIRTV